MNTTESKQQAESSKTPEAANTEQNTDATKVETTEPVAAVDKPEKTASADLVIELCEQAGMQDQIANLVKAKLTEAGVQARLTTLGGVRDTLAAANLGHLFAEVSAKMDNPAEMLQVALTAATAHGEDREVNSSKQVVTEAAVKQPDVKKAYSDPSRL